MGIKNERANVLILQVFYNQNFVIDMKQTKMSMDFSNEAKIKRNEFQFQFDSNVRTTTATTQNNTNKHEKSIRSTYR